MIIADRNLGHLGPDHIDSNIAVPVYRDGRIRTGRILNPAQIESIIVNNSARGPLNLDAIRLCLVGPYCAGNGKFAVLNGDIGSLDRNDIGNFACTTIILKADTIDLAAFRIRFKGQRTAESDVFRRSQGDLLVDRHSFGAVLHQCDGIASTGSRDSVGQG